MVDQGRKYLLVPFDTPDLRQGEASFLNKPIPSPAAAVGVVVKHLIPFVDRQNDMHPQLEL